MAKRKTGLESAVRTFVAAVRHVFSGGKTTYRRAARKAAAPARRCSECHQPVPHSHDWRDHL